jgi:Glutathione-dependent formaldehyde-activating enzyme
MAKKVIGGCACGSIRYELLDKPMFVHCCHCDDCQRLTGSAFVLNAIIETEAIKLRRGKPVAVPVPRENGTRHLPLPKVSDRALERLWAQTQSPVRARRNARQARFH